MKIQSVLAVFLALFLAACGGVSAAENQPTATDVPPEAVPSPTAEPTPDISAYLQMELSEGDEKLGQNVAIAFRCQGCHNSASRPQRGPRFAAVDDLPPIMERGEMRIADPAYGGQAATNLAYVLESIFNPHAYTAPGEWRLEMDDDFAGRIEDEELVNLIAWLETFSEPAE
jgi:cytochrome c2